MEFGTTESPEYLPDPRTDQSSSFNVTAAAPAVKQADETKYPQMDRAGPGEIPKGFHENQQTSTPKPRHWGLGRNLEASQKNGTSVAEGERAVGSFLGLLDPRKKGWEARSSTEHSELEIFNRASRVFFLPNGAALEVLFSFCLSLVRKRYEQLDCIEEGSLYVDFYLKLFALLYRNGVPLQESFCWCSL